MTFQYSKPERPSNNRHSSRAESPNIYFSKSMRNTKLDSLIDFSQLKSSNNSIYNQSSSSNPKVIKPTSPPVKDSSNQKVLFIRPPDSNRETNPRFLNKEVNPKFTNPRFSRSASSARTNSKGRIRPLKKFTSQKCEYRVTFSSFSKIVQRRKKNAQLYYKFGIRLLSETNGQKRAAHYIKISADEGNVMAMFRYATMLYDGYNSGINRSPYQPFSMLRYNRTNRLSGVKKDRKEAARYFKMAADLGDLRSMRKLRSMLYEGEGVEKDRKAAAALFKIDADQGIVEAICQYGSMLFLGDGVEKDRKEAARYFKMAIDKGDPVGMRNYAYMFQTGKGVDYSLKDAIFYYQMAADLGDEVSVKQIVKILNSGKGFLMHKKEAAKYYKILADKGDDDAMKKYQSIISGKK